MKYAKVLNDKLKEFPDNIKNKCLPYKQWKKKISNDPIDIIETWQKQLYKQCNKINRLIFPTAFNNIICFSNKTDIGAKTRAELCDINSKTLYKICKKLEKKLEVPALEYIENLKYEFPFIQSAQKTKLELTATEDNVKCNQCNTPEKLYLIMRCGHYMCEKCTVSKWNLKHFSHRELESKAYEVRCPECSAAVPCNLLLGAELYKNEKI
jgi:hypothetical protein